MAAPQPVPPSPRIWSSTANVGAVRPERHAEDAQENDGEVTKEHAVSPEERRRHPARACPERPPT